MEVSSSNHATAALLPGKNSVPNAHAAVWTYSECYFLYIIMSKLYYIHAFFLHQWHIMILALSLILQQSLTCFVHIFLKFTNLLHSWHIRNTTNLLTNHVPGEAEHHYKKSPSSSVSRPRFGSGTTEYFYLYVYLIPFKLICVLSDNILNTRKYTIFSKCSLYIYVNIYNAIITVLDKINLVKLNCPCVRHVGMWVPESQFNTLFISPRSVID